MSNKVIAMFNLTETTRDPRVRRIAGVLAEQGHRVIVFGMKSESNINYERFGNFEIVRVDIPQVYTDVEMEKIRTTCSLAGKIIEWCNPNVMSEKISFAKRIQLKCQNGYRRYIKKVNTVEDGKFNPQQEILAIRSIMLINLALYEAAIEYKPDIAHCNDLDTLLAGLMLKTNANIPLIFDAHEIYPEQLAVHMRSEIWYQFYSRLEKKLLAYTDGRMTVCDSLGKYFQEIVGSGEFTTIRNVVTKQYLPDSSILDRVNNPVRILYHGAYFQYRGLDEIIEAAPLVKNAVFVFRGIGQYESVLRQKVKEKGLEEKIIFEEPVAVDRLVETACENDIGLNPFISVCKNTEYALPINSLNI